MALLTEKHELVNIQRPCWEMGRFMALLTEKQKLENVFFRFES